jgi:hypothetical protein
MVRIAIWLLLDENIHGNRIATSVEINVGYRELAQFC